MKQKKILQHHDLIYSFFNIDVDLLPNESFCREITFQVTEECNLACTYCYEKHKTNKMMTKETGKAIVDLLFKMWDDNNDIFINQNTKSIILSFIGGEQFLNTKTMDYICSYFIDTCLERHHPWLLYFKISMASNGTLYFHPEVQQFIKKYKNFLSFSISIDGPEEIHDACRIYPNGKGSFKEANAAEQAYMKLLPENAKFASKATIAPENLTNMNKIIHYFIDNGKLMIFANTVHEAEWTLEHAKIFYNELKKMADYLLELNNNDLSISLFDDEFFRPIAPHNLQCWCGGAGKMLAFDPNGKAYPCLRYMPTSLGDIPPIIIGDTTGIYKTEEAIEIRKKLESINRRTKSDDECFYCPIAAGCSDCEAWNYQSANGKFNIKNKNICWMHRARALANYYYWNKYYQQNNIDKIMPIYIEKDIALQIISQDEWEMLCNLLKK